MMNSRVREAASNILVRARELNAFKVLGRFLTIQEVQQLLEYRDSNGIPESKFFHPLTLNEVYYLRLKGGPVDHLGQLEKVNTPECWWGRIEDGYITVSQEIDRDPYAAKKESISDITKSFCR